jgi:hypothetical protein
MPQQIEITTEELARLPKRTSIYPVFGDSRGPPCVYNTKAGCLAAKFVGDLIALTDEVEIDGVLYKTRRSGSEIADKLSAGD